MGFRSGTFFGQSLGAYWASSRPRSFIAQGVLWRFYSLCKIIRRDRITISVMDRNYLRPTRLLRR
jgi:hypothetical protein